MLKALIGPLVLFVILGVSAISGPNLQGLSEVRGEVLKSPPAKDIYVDNILGSDKYDGLSPKPTGSSHGPVATMTKAVSLLKTSDHLNIANTGKPYRDSIHLFQQGGTPEKPTLIEGNGAIMEGLETVQPSAWTVEPDGLLSITWGNYLSFAVWVDGRIPARRVDVTARPSINDIAPGTGVFATDKMRAYFRLPEGKRLQDLHLDVPRKTNGVTIHESSYVTVRNLHARFYADDGFNEAGQCYGLLYENIEASYNGEQGMSAHNAVSVTVFNAYFHDNMDGIADVQFSQTLYHGLRCSNNWRYGVLFLGGYHLVTDAQLQQNGEGVVFQAQSDMSTYGPEHAPFGEGQGRLYNVYVRGGKSGLDVQSGSKVSVEHATFVGNERGVILGAGCRLHMVNSMVAKSKTAELDLSGDGYFGGYNLWSTGAIRVAGKTNTLQNWSAGKGIEEHSLFTDPRLAGEVGPELEADSPARGKAYWSKSMAGLFKSFHSAKTDTEPYSNADIGARFSTNSAAR
jgi:hypothetical protein